MSEYVIFADSSCDVTPDLLEKWGVSFCSLGFTFDGSP